jgi:plastocyanin
VIGRPAPSPGRPSHGRPGFFYAVTLLAIIACERGSAPASDRTLPLGKDTIQLEATVNLIDVRLRTGQPDGHFAPDTVRAHPKDVLRFTSADAMTHAVSFDAADLVPAIRAFLERTSQLRGPPLLSAGASWVLNLDGAPVGVYPFTCLSHNAHGALIVE